MNVAKGLAANKDKIERELARILPRGSSRLDQAMRYSVLDGGKRFRPLLLISSGKCFGVYIRVLLPFACALELIHSYSLIHDDLPAMDDDDVRRGKPSCHRVFGEDIALLAGDGLLTLAFETLAAAAVPAGLLSRKQEAARTIGRRAGAEGMIGGQFLDITVEPSRLASGLMEEIIQKKTGALISASVEVGAILGRAAAAEKRAILAYGRRVGLAFQIRDDLQDSRREKSRKSPRRPDYALRFGRDAAEKKLVELVSGAVGALERFSKRADELRFLAASLLEENSEFPHA
jgi:geranylgeranyl diphosphate synthase type II